MIVLQLQFINYLFFWYKFINNNKIKMSFQNTVIIDFIIIKNKIIKIIILILINFVLIAQNLIKYD